MFLLFSCPGFDNVPCLGVLFQPCVLICLTFVINAPLCLVFSCPGFDNVPCLGVLFEPCVGLEMCLVWISYPRFVCYYV